MGWLFLQDDARSENELAKAQDDGQSNQKYSNYDPNDYLHRLPLRKWVSSAIVLRFGPANLQCWRFVAVVHSRQSGARWGRAGANQQPSVHLPALSNAIVFPERGICTGTFTAFMKASVLLPVRTFPLTVPTSLAWEAITDAGFTRSLMT